MLKSNRLLLLLVSVLSVTTLLALAANYTQYKRLNGYYKDLNDVRLNPIGVRYHPSDDTPAETALPVILMYGDSRAFQWPAPSGLEDQMVFVNRGVGSETSVQSRLRWRYHVPQVQPDIVVLQIGINDLKTIQLFPTQRDAIVENTKQNIEVLIAAAHAEGAQVVLTTIFPVGEVPLARKLVWSDEIEVAIADVNTHLLSLADAPLVTVIDTAPLLTNGTTQVDAAYRHDLLHLNAAGYDALNAALVPILEDLLATQ